MKSKLFKFGSKLYFFVFGMLLFTINVKAYIDPSVMTYTIQAIAGIAIAIGAIVSIYFRKFKKKLGKKMGIDEYKNKEVESDDIFVNNKKNNK